MVPIVYKLKFDEIMAYTPDERAEASTRMARSGLWLGDGWWKPDPSQDAEARIEREGFIIVDKKQGCGGVGTKRRTHSRLPTRKGNA